MPKQIQSVCLAELHIHNNVYYADGNSWFCIKIPKKFHSLIKKLKIKEETDFVVTIDQNNKITAIQTIESINTLISFFKHSFKQT